MVIITIIIIHEQQKIKLLMCLGVFSIAANWGHKPDNK